MKNSYDLYENYVHGVRCACAILFMLLSFNEWLEKHGIDDNSSVSSATSAISVPSPK